MLSYTNFAELCNDNENPFSYFIDWLGGMTAIVEDRHGK